MSRVKVKFPTQKSLYNTTIPIRIGDINYGNHLGNDAVLSIVHECRVQLLNKYGFTELDAGGVGLIMADTAIVYKGEGFYGDVLNVEIYATELTMTSFDLLYNISTKRREDIISIAHAKTGMVCFDYKTRKVSPIPESLKSMLESV